MKRGKVLRNLKKMLTEMSVPHEKEQKGIFSGRKTLYEYKLGDKKSRKNPVKEFAELFNRELETAFDNPKDSVGGEIHNIMELSTKPLKMIRELFLHTKKDYMNESYKEGYGNEKIYDTRHAIEYSPDGEQSAGMISVLRKPKDNYKKQYKPNIYK